MSEKIKELLKNYWFDGILLICLGILILVWPNAAPKILCIASGIILAVLGIIKTIGFFADKNDERKPSALFIGLVQLAAGIVILINLEFFINSFQIISAVLMLFGCILMVVQAFELRKTKGPRLIASIVFAVVTLILAVIMLVNPGEFNAVMTRITAIALIVEGLAIIIVLRKPEKKKVQDKSNQSR